MAVASTPPPGRDFDHAVLEAWLRTRLAGTGGALSLAHAVVRQYRVISTLAATDVPVPQPLIFCGAVIFAGIAARARGGGTAADDAAAVSELAPVFARRAVETIMSAASGA